MDQTAFDFSPPAVAKGITAARSVEAQTGWRRGHPLMICQETAVLLAVTEFDYALTAREFVGYFERRTGQQISRCECGMAAVQAVWGNPAVPTEDKSWRITRAKLQDCWELFRGAEMERRAA